MANFSPHIDGYRSFWTDRFPEVFSKFIDELWKSSIGKLVNKYLPEKVEVDCEIKEQAISEEHCRQAGLSYTQRLFVKIALGSREPRIFLGNIPKITDRGTFIINGVERAIVAKLEPAPGLFFEERTSKKGETWNVACFRPTKRPFLHRNYFITFELKDGLTVSINGNSVPPLTFLRSLGFSNDELEDIFDENIDLLQKLKDEESKREKRANSKPKLESAEVCRQLGIEEFELKDEADYRGEIKEVCDALLSENYFSSAGRWQINRKLKRLDGYQLQDSEYLTKEDIYYALKYLLKTANTKYPLDDPYSLANNRIRLVDELILDSVEAELNKAFRRMMGQAVGTQDRDRCKSDQVIIKFIGSLRKVLTNGKVFEKQIERFFTLSKFSRLVPQDNALAASALARRIEWTCPLGIKSNSTESVSSRQLHWSHRGRICPVDTSQSDKIGLALSLTKEAKIDQKNGQILAPFSKVSQQNKTFKIESKDLYLSAGFEEALMLEGKFIAYSDMPYVDWNESVLKNTDDDSKVIARSGADELKEVEFSKIAFVESPKLIGMSLAASMIPFIEHNDVNRAMMGCNVMRQALPLKNAKAPVVSTKSEGELQDYLGSLSYGEFADNCPAFGVNALVAFIPWEGLNFEDAIVISEDFSEYLTSIHTLNSIDVHEFIIGEGKDKKTVSEKTKHNDIDKLDKNGIIKVEEKVVGGDVLVYKEKKDGKTVFEDNSVRVPDDLHGKVISVEILEHNLPLNVLKRIIIKVERKVTIGDKLSNRHGGKGVISAILPKEKMPYIIDPNSGKKQYVDAILNPLGVISRLNPGQLYETHLGLVSYLKGTKYELEPFSQKVIKISAEGGREEFDVPDMRKFVEEELESIESVNEGKIPLFHPDNQEQPIGKVVVGKQYLMKLNQLAEKKEHGRGSGRHYDMIASQPIQSRRLEHGERLEGGARVGEMEVWALSSHGASELLQEFFTLKSDNRSKRRRMKRILSGELRQRYPRPNLPEAVRSFIWLLRGLCLEIVSSPKELSSFLSKKELKPEEVQAVQIRLISPSVLKSESEGEVKIRDFGKLESALSTGGLLDPLLFRDEKGKWLGELPPYSRTKMGHIALAREVIHPLFFSVIAELFGISRNALLAILSRKREIPFSSNDQLDGLIRLCWKKSSDFKDTFSNNVPEDKSLDDWLNETNLLSKKPAINACFQMCSGVGVLCDVLSCFDKEFIEAQLDKAQRELEKQRRKAQEELEKQRERSETKRVKEPRKNRIKRLERQIRCHQILLDNEWTGDQFLIKNLPVIPVPLRYPYLLSADRISRSDLHILYENVIKYNDNARTDQQVLENSKTPKTIQRHISTRRLPGYESQLQLAVDALYTNRQKITSRSGRPLKSILDMLGGKDGLCKRKMVGKRINYSARAVIVPGLDLQIDECGLPLKIAIKLFRDILLRNCDGKSSREKPGCFSEQAEMLDNVWRNPESSDRRVVESLLSKLFKERKYPVLLNRQPTLHRLGVQAFFPKLTEHHCIAVHPLITAGFGADFDGDTMAVYLPVTPKAREDARQMINRDVRSPANGNCTLNLSQDITLGLYWLCHFGNDKQKQELRDIVGDFPESQDEKLRDWIGQKIIELSRTLPSNKWRKKIQELQTLLFKSATSSGLSFEVFDFPVFSGLSTYADQSKVEQQVEKDLEELEPEDSLKILYKSKARGSLQTFTTLIAGRQFPHPRKDEQNPPSNEKIIIDRGLITGYKSGEFFASCHGSRATQVDKNLNTGVAGGLYKRLVSITEGLFITEEDCQTEQQNRSPVTCRSKSGICQKCYGNDLSTGEQVEIGTAVGLLAAQSIGERGTQLTISAFHTGDRMVGLLDQANNYFDAKMPAMSKLGETLSGLPPTKEAQQIQKVLETIVDKAIKEASKIYESVEIDQIHFEVILKAMLDYVKLEDGRIVHRQVYESQEDKQKGVQCLVGVRDAIYYHPGWLAQIAGANRVNRLVEILAKSVLECERDLFMMPREQLMFGKLISKPSKGGEK